MRVLAALPTSALWSAWAQESFPSKSITVVVPYAPGGSIDSMARLVSDQMAKVLGQAFLVENRAGAAGLIGADAVNRSKPDGYTLLCTANGSITVAPRMVPKRPFGFGDFAPVGAIGSTTMVLAGSASGRFKSLFELMAFAKANPGHVTIGHPGNGTTNHIAILRLQEASGVRFNIVPYKGSALALTDALGGQIDGLFDQLPSSLPQVKARKLIAFAVTSKDVSPYLPGVKPLAEAGFPNFNVTTVTGLFAPAKTPSEVVEILNRALQVALTDTQVLNRLKEMGADPMQGTARRLSEFLAAEDGAAETMFRQGLLKPE